MKLCDITLQIREVATLLAISQSSTNNKKISITEFHREDSELQRDKIREIITLKSE